MAQSKIAHSQCPGKLILSGEHATVYGKNAVAVTVDLYTETKVFEPSCAGQLELVLSNFDFQLSWPIELLASVYLKSPNKEIFEYNEEILAKVSRLLEGHEQGKEMSHAKHQSCIAFLLLYLSISDFAAQSKRTCWTVEVSSRMPHGAGLGSSSALIVSLASALFAAFEVTIEKDAFNRWCYEVDKLFHGKPSGIDNSICTYGGAILFGKGQIIETIDSTQLTELSNNFRVILVNTKVPRSTKAMVERCRARLDSYRPIVEHVFDAIAHVSQTLWDELKMKDFSKLATLFEINQNLLSCLDIGHEKIDQVINIVKQHGCSAKLTGAGGGGIVLAFTDKPSAVNEALIEQLHSSGFECYQVKLGVPGVANV